MDTIPTGDLTGWLGPWARGPGPLYRRLADALRRVLEAGHVQHGATLPPERKLASALAVSRNTVSAAYAELRRDGWIDARQGSSTRVVTTARHSPVGAHRANGLFATLLREHPDVLDLTIAVPDAAPIVAAVLASPGDHLDPAGLSSGHGYHPRGHPALRARLADILTDHGLATTSDQLIVTNGAQQAISLVVDAVVRPGESVAIEEVSFPGAVDAISRRSGRLVPVPFGSSGMELDALETVLERDRPRLLYTIPTFHNPTGIVVDGVDRKRLARLVAESDTTVIDDLTLAELDHQHPAPPPLAAIEPEAPIISVGGMSKVFWGGLRIGWVRASVAVIDHLSDLKAAADLGTSSATQRMAIPMLDRYDETRDWRNQQLRLSLRAAADALDRFAPGWEWETPAGGPHLWIRLPGTDTMAFANLMLRHGIAVVPGAMLAAGAATAEDRIRLPLYRSPTQLAGAIAQMAGVWSAANGGTAVAVPEEASH